MEKIEVAIRLRPLNCNPAELNTLVVEDPMAVQELWRIEGDNRTLRLLPAMEQVAKGNNNRSFYGGLSR
jgi:hypothetical protein